MAVDLRGPAMPAGAAWDLVADPDHLFRVAGLPPVRGALCALPGEAPVFRGELLGPAGLRHRVTALEQDWEVGRHHQFLWRLDGPLLQSLRFEGILEGEGEQRRVRLRLRWGLRSALLRPAVGLVGLLVERAWRGLLARSAAEGLGPRRILDPAARTALARLGDRGAPAAFLGVLRGWLEHTPRARLKAVEAAPVAAAAGMPVEAVQRWLIEGVAVGLFDLSYLLRCGACGLLAATLGRPEALAAVGDCPYCRAALRVDLHETVFIGFSARFGVAGGGIEGDQSPAGAPELLRAAATLTGRSLSRGEAPMAPGISAWAFLTDPFAAQRLGPPALGLHVPLPLRHAGLLLVGLGDEEGLFEALGDAAGYAALTALDEALAAAVAAAGGVLVDRGGGEWLAAFAAAGALPAAEAVLRRAARVWAAGLPVPEPPFWAVSGSGPAVAVGDSERALSVAGVTVSALRRAGGEARRAYRSS